MDESDSDPGKNGSRSGSERQEILNPDPEPPLEKQANSTLYKFNLRFLFNIKVNFYPNDINEPRCVKGIKQ